MHKICVVSANYYQEITDNMEEGIKNYLKQHDDIICDFEQVTGAFELPASIQILNSTGQYHGFVALGCVMKGETDHYDYICREVSRGLMDLTISSSIALGFGVLTVDQYSLALERSLISGKNKGEDAIRACINMIKLKDRYLK